jgi:hypothetical protein
VQVAESHESSPPIVTPSMLRRADEMCRRRLAREHAGAKRFANKAADARFAVSNRLLADVRLAHNDHERVRAEAFVEPQELEPEQRLLYRAAVRGYLARFGEQPGRAADLGWRTSLPSLGVELLGDPGVALELNDGTRELRIVKLGGRRAVAPLLDPVELRCALVRTAQWAPVQLRVIVVDVIEQECIIHEPDLVAERLEATAWITQRVERVTELSTDGRARAGSDCIGCAFIAGCEAHT